MNAASAVSSGATRGGPARRVGGALGRRRLGLIVIVTAILLVMLSMTSYFSSVVRDADVAIPDVPRRHGGAGSATITDGPAPSSAATAGDDEATPSADHHSESSSSDVMSGKGRDAHGGGNNAAGGDTTNTARHFPQECRHLGPNFEKAVREWLSKPPAQQLVYNCEASKKGRLCGGMGDRFRGMISVAYLSLVFRRSFKLYHPVPVPLQEYLEPNLVDWGLPASVDEQERESWPLNSNLMRLNKHGSFMRAMANEKGDLWRASTLRLQSNSFGVDPYVHRIGKFSKRITDELGLSKSCNITCYFSCFYSLLFRPSDALREATEASFSTIKRDIVWLDDEHGRRTGRFALSGGAPYIGVQIRMGGDWAKGLKVPEPFRTPPSAVDHFFSIFRELRSGGAAAAPARGDLSRAPIFITSDSEKLVNMTRDTFSPSSVFTVPGSVGDCYTHTDSSHIGKINPAKWKMDEPERIRRNYLCTLTSHFIVANSAHVVMAQSGFGDTAFWRSRGEASCLFVDMTNLRWAWQHRLSFGACDAPQGRVGRNCSSTDEGSAASDGGCGCPAVPSMNRAVDLKQPVRGFYGKKG